MLQIRPIYCREASRYLFNVKKVHDMRSCVTEMEKIKKRARSLLVVVSTPPTENYGTFTAKVKEYNDKEPFNFHTPVIFRDYEKVF